MIDLENYIHDKTKDFSLQKCKKLEEIVLVINNVRTDKGALFNLPLDIQINMAIDIYNKLIKDDI